MIHIICSKQCLTDCTWFLLSVRAVVLSCCKCSLGGLQNILEATLRGSQLSFPFTMDLKLGTVLSALRTLTSLNKWEITILVFCTNPPFHILNALHTQSPTTSLATYEVGTLTSIMKRKLPFSREYDYHTWPNSFNIPFTQIGLPVKYRMPS